MAYGTIAADVITGTNGNSFSPESSVFRNRIINGAMVIDQRNAGASVTVNGAAPYTLDRWRAQDTTDGVFTVQQDAGAVTPPAGFTDYLGVTTTTADSSLSASQVARVWQAIEGYNIADLGWGTANAKTVTVSFWVRSSLTGSFGGSLLNGSDNRAYPFNYTINSANTWEQKSVTIPGDTSGTWNTTNSVGVYLIFGLGVGSTFSGTANAWASSELYAPTGSVSVIGTLNATWYITGVQLEVGSQATSFDYRQYGTEFALCQRYYEKSYNQSVAVPTVTYDGISFESTWGNSANRPLWDRQFAVVKRAAATMTFYSPNSTTAGKCGGPSGADYNCSLNYAGQRNFTCYQAGGSGATVGADWYLHWAASAEL